MSRIAGKPATRRPVPTPGQIWYPRRRTGSTKPRRILAFDKTMKIHEWGITIQVEGGRTRSLSLRQWRDWVSFYDAMPRKTIAEQQAMIRDFLRSDPWGLRSSTGLCLIEPIEFSNEAFSNPSGIVIRPPVPDRFVSQAVSA